MIKKMHPFAIFQLHAIEWGLSALFLLQVCTGLEAPWIDEIAGMAFAGFSTTSDMLAALYNTMPTVNHGQTGLYYILQSFSLDLVGAQLWAIRWPSFVGFAISLVCLCSILRMMGASLFIRVVSLVYYANTLAMQAHASDGRPYMPFAATLMFFMLVWTARFQKFISEESSYWWMFAALLIGFAFHPYFVMYIGLLIVLLPIFSKLFRQDLLRLLHVGNRGRSLVLVLATVIVFLLIAGFTWMRGMGSLGFDPYRWIGRDQHILTIMVGSIMGPYTKPWVLFTAFGVGISTWLWIKKRVFTEEQRIALGLTVTVIAAQAVLYYSSVSSGYWLLRRQWIGSTGLMILATGILAIHLSKLSWFQDNKIVKKFARKELWLCSGIFLLAILFVGPKIKDNLAKELGPTFTQNEFQKVICDPEIKMVQGLVVRLATHNFYQGGEVFPIFACYYDSDCNRELLLKKTHQMYCSE